MRSLLPAVLLLCGCAPATAVIDDGPVNDESDPGPCDATFAAAPAWLAQTRDYGMVRGAADFDADGSEFVNTAGVYDAVARTYDVATGTVLSEARTESWLVAREAGVELRYGASASDATTADLVVVDAATGVLRATIPDAGLRWAWPSVAVRDGTIAVFRCSDTEVASIATYDLDGRTTASWELDIGCSPWMTGLVDVAPALGLAAVHGGTETGSAALVDLGTGRSRALAAHGPPASDLWGGTGWVVDLAFSRDGSRLGTAGADGRLFLHDTGDVDDLDERVLAPTPVNRNIYAQPDTRGPFAWSSDGALLARATDGAIVVERVCDGDVLAELPFAADLSSEWSGEESRPAVLRFAPDDDALVAVYEAGVQAFLAD